MIKGIGPVYAKKLVQAFGATVFDAIEQAPERLQEVAGIGPKRALRMVFQHLPRHRHPRRDLRLLAVIESRP